MSLKYKISPYSYRKKGRFLTDEKIKEANFHTEKSLFDCLAPTEISEVNVHKFNNLIIKVY